LSCPPYQVIALDTWRHSPGLVSQALCVIFEALL
jgi:hypothetical protein